MEESQKCMADKISALEILMVIIDRETIREVECRIQNLCKGNSRGRLLYVMNAMGTANSNIMDMLGLDSEEKGILLCIDKTEHIEIIKEEIGRTLRLEKPGTGILFTLPISKTCSLYKMENRGDYVETREKTGYDLFMTIINQGYSDDVISAVKKAGAKGGTIIRARRIGMEEAIKLFGISAHKEKEILLTIAPRRIENDILKAIKPFCGLQSEARGISFTLAADNVIGLSFEE